MRILIISIGSLIALGTIILTARIWGMGQSYSAYEHSYFAQPGPAIAIQAQDLQNAQEIVQAKADAIIWVDVRFSRDKETFVLPTTMDKVFLNDRREKQKANPGQPIFTGSKLAEYTWEEIHNFFPQTQLLKDFYTTLPNTRFILNIVDNVSEAHSTLVTALEGTKPNERTLIQGEALIILTSIKELKPEWLYGTSKPDLMRFLAFDSMWILPSVQFSGDIFLAPFKLSNRPAFNDNILVEARRRLKKVVLGPLNSQEELLTAQNLNADGYIFKNLADFHSWLVQSPAN